MAKRFGGKYSPQGTAKDLPQPEPRGAYDRAEISPVGARANIMFFPAIVLVATTFMGGAVSMATGLVGAAVLVLAAWLLREGLKAEAAFNARKVARKPAIPRKIFAAILAGIGTATAVVAHQDSLSLFAPLLYGAAVTGLHLAAFGLDPLADKGMEGIDTLQQDRVARVVDEAEAYLSAMTGAIARSGDRQMERRLEDFQTTARDLIRTVEEDPRDLTSARKYLGVYLMGARDATVKFADIYARTQDPKAREDYAALLDDLSTNFAQKTQKLLVDDRSDLNVEIEVLRERLSLEGVRLAPNDD